MPQADVLFGITEIGVTSTVHQYDVSKPVRSARISYILMLAKQLIYADTGSGLQSEGKL